MIVDHGLANNEPRIACVTAICPSRRSLHNATTVSHDVSVARVSETTVAELNASISLERLVAARGIELREHAGTLLGSCPWCGQADCLVLKPKPNTWACEPCKLGGGVVDWVQRIEGVSLKHAVELLREDVLGEPAGRVVRKATIPKLGGVVDADADPHAIVRAVIDYYHECLKQSPEALAYLDRRGLRDSAMIEQFRLGFCNRTLAYRIPAKNRKAGAAIRGVLTEAGLLKSSGHEYFRGSVVFPVLDGERVVQCYGRKITGNLRKGTPDHLWLPGPRRGVWNRAALSRRGNHPLREHHRRAHVLVRRLPARHGGRRARMALTDELIEAIGSSPVRRVLIGFDHDEAGDAGADAAAERLMAVGAECFRVALPKGQDVNSHYLASDCSAEALGAVLRAARWLGKGQGRPAQKSTLQAASAASAIETRSGIEDATDETTPPLAEQAPTDEAGSARHRYRGLCD